MNNAIPYYMRFAWPPQYNLAIADYMVDLKSPCKYCGTDLTKLHPQANLYPHMTGACGPPRRER